ncbi:RNA polymerase sigma factor [Sphingobacterium thalpophilum]|uniref:Sigma-24 n=1 Tax=Sphingobacterium thalpophilum TaxID=259 RepID=A0A4U9W8K9_9SPHI|nr:MULTISPECIES: sigma-70 family RNA polymerase sigma factor [Sphingobacterium]MDM1296332.1 sigma-70 family RNA polymerase sigma factor [Sphingobacterium sp. N143]VTR55179.1 Sigma-24 [Sphingobacterium thalpophilum]
MDYTSEKKLLEDFRNGEEQACAHVYNRYFARICLYAASFVNETREAEDIAEEGFIRLWQGKRDFESLQHLRAALYQTTRRVGLNHQTARQRRSDRVDAYVSQQEQDQGSHLQEIVYAETMAELYRAIQNLPPKAREIVRLTYLEGHSNQEVAELLQISIQTVKNQKLRALSLLRQQLSSDSFRYLLSLIVLFGKI